MTATTLHSVIANVSETHATLRQPPPQEACLAVLAADVKGSLYVRLATTLRCLFAHRCLCSWKGRLELRYVHFSQSQMPSCTFGPKLRYGHLAGRNTQQLEQLIQRESPVPPAYHPLPPTILESLAVKPYSSKVFKI